MRAPKTRDFSGIRTEDLEIMLASGTSVYTKDEQKSIRAELAKRNGKAAGRGGEEAGLPRQREKAVAKRKVFLTFKGRLGRLKYYLNSLLSFAATAVTVGVVKAMGNELISFLAVPAIVYLAIGEFSVVARRFHDLNRSGWWSLLFFIPIVNLFVGLYLLFKKGTKGPNRFGPDPLSQYLIG